MKRLLLLSIILAAFSAPVHAVAIQAYAINVDATFGSFSAKAGGAALSTDADIQAIISSDVTTAIFGQSAVDYSVIDLDFGGTTVMTGSGAGTLGADLAVVSLWSGYDYTFGLQAFDTLGSSLSSYNYSVTGGTPGADVKTTSINLYSNDATALELVDGIEIGYIRLFIGGSTYNGVDGGLDAYSNFSLVGAYHTDAVVVPLPLPAILFGSGLGLLGLIGRRKSKA